MKNLNTPILIIMCVMSSFKAPKHQLVNSDRNLKQTIADSITTSKFGVGPTKSVGEMGKLQQFFDYCAEKHITGIVTKGEYKIFKPILIGSNSTIKFEAGARFIRAYKSGSGFGSSTIQQKIKDKPIENVRLINFNLGLENPECIGRQLTLYANNLKVERLTIDGFRGAMAIVVAGNNIVMDGIHIKNSGGEHGEGGIRVEGGNNIKISNSDVESGDDCFQFVPSAAPEDPLFNLDISNGEYKNCIGRSMGARLIVVAKGENNTCSIRNVSFINIKGSGGERQLLFQDQSKRPFRTTLIKMGGNSYKLGAGTLDNRGRAIFKDGDEVEVKSGRKMGNGKISVSGDGYTLAGNLGDINLNFPVILTKTNTGVIDGITLSNFDADCAGDKQPESIYIDHVTSLKSDNIKLRNLKEHSIKTVNYSGSWAKPQLF